jgi:hypothetical protein
VNGHIPPFTKGAWYAADYCEGFNTRDEAIKFAKSVGLAITLCPSLVFQFMPWNPPFNDAPHLDY